MIKNLNEYIEKKDNENIVQILEYKVENNSASNDEKLLLGVLLMMPPLVDEEAASRMFISLYEGELKLTAAIWDCYRYATLFPDGDASFENILTESADGIALHVLSSFHSSQGEIKMSIIENRNSIKIKKFPFNILKFIELNDDLSKSDLQGLWISAEKLIFEKKSERSMDFNVQDCLRSHFDNLITGVSMTSVLFDYYNEKYGK